jgi:hypothetical protein
MIDLNNLLNIVGQVVALIAVAITVSKAVSRVEYQLSMLRFHLESHCIRLTHISEFLDKNFGYQPIDKQDIDQ